MAPRSIFLLALALLVASASGCSKRRRYAPREVAKVLNVTKESLAPAIAERIGSADRPAWVTPERWTRVSSLYKAYDNSPLWLEEGGVKERASALLAALQDAPSHSLRTDAYPLDSIRRWVSVKRIDSTAAPSDGGRSA